MGTRGLLMRRGLAYLSIYRSRIPGSVRHEYREADSRLRHTTRITPTTPATPTGATHPNYPINFQANYPYSTVQFLSSTYRCVRQNTFTFPGFDENDAWSGVKISLNYPYNEYNIITCQVCAA